MTIETRLSANGEKTYYRFKWGNNPNQRSNAGVWTYTKPKDQIQRNHNKESLLLLEMKRSQLSLDLQSVGTGYIPAHRFQNNFFDFYDDFVKKHVRVGKRHLATSFKHFKTFVGKKSIPPIEITEDLCVRFRNFLLQRFNGETPMNYFSEFKRMVRAAFKQGYFRQNPAEDVKAKPGKNRRLKEHLEVGEYLKLIATPCLNEEVREAFILSCYTGLRWADVSVLSFKDIGEDSIRTRIVQVKTGLPVVITMHPVARQIVEKRKKRWDGEDERQRMFRLPTANGANKLLRTWTASAGIKKTITWSSARLSFAILLQDQRIDNATVALLLGHTTTKYVNETYKRHRPKDQVLVIATLPMPVQNQSEMSVTSWCKEELDKP